MRRRLKPKELHRIVLALKTRRYAKTLAKHPVYVHNNRQRTPLLRKRQRKKSRSNSPGPEAKASGFFYQQPVFNPYGWSLDRINHKREKL